jgi:hypothetical protein
MIIVEFVHLSEGATGVAQANGKGNPGAGTYEVVHEGEQHPSGNYEYEPSHLGFNPDERTVAIARQAQNPSAGT